MSYPVYKLHDISMFTALFQVHIEFTDGEDKILCEGPPEDVDKAEIELNKLTADLVCIYIYIYIYIYISSIYIQ